MQQQGQGKAYHGLTNDAVDYYQMFYKIPYGNPKAVECAHTFLGAGCILLGVDFPLGDTEHGGRNCRQPTKAIDEMAIMDEDRKKIRNVS